MSNECNGCGDPSIPTVNNEAKECCELYPANCVVTSEYQSYFKIGVGKTLTYVINTIAKFVKKNQIRIDVLESLRDYKIVEGILDQEASDDPTGVFVKNETTVTPVLVRVNPGKYTLTMIGVFTAGKTFIDIKEFNIGWGEKVKAYWVDVNTIAIESGSSTDFIDDDVITSMPIEIKIYD